MASLEMNRCIVLFIGERSGVCVCMNALLINDEEYGWLQ